MDIKLIAFDLDGTILDSNKDLPPENKWALEKAASAGIQVVPATGRFYNGMPQCIKELPFINYAITINGAEVLNVKTGDIIYKAEIPLKKGLEVLEYLKGLGVAYDAYIGSQGYMGKYHMDNIENYLRSEVYCRTVRSMRKPVKDLIPFVKEKGLPLQKTQMFTLNMETLLGAIEHVNTVWPDLIATSSLTTNLEINNKLATKGQALKALADHLSLDIKQTMAFGDGGNDFDMIETAGIGVAMGNAVDRIKKGADLITLTNDGCGAAYAINKLLF